MQIGYPIGASTRTPPRAREARIPAGADAAEDMKLQIATQVREAARNVTTNQKLVQAAPRARELRKKKLEAEEKSSRQGCRPASSSSRHSDLSQRGTGNPGDLDYTSRGRFRAVQLAPITGNAGNVNVAGQQSIFNQGFNDNSSGIDDQIADCGCELRNRKSNPQISIRPIRNPHCAIRIRNTLDPSAEALGHHHHPERSGRHGDALASVAWADEIVVVDSETPTRRCDRPPACHPSSSREWPGYVEQKTTPPRSRATTGSSLDADER